MGAPRAPDDVLPLKEGETLVSSYEGRLEPALPSGLFD